MAETAEDQDHLDDYWADEDENESNSQKYLLFNLGEELYGINIIDITEIIEMQRITEIPDMPDFIRGVINLRGKVIPLMDLRLRFRMPEREYDDRTCIVVARIDETSLGLIVDTVAEVHDIPRENIEKTPGFSSSEKQNFVEGVGKVGDRVTVLIDARKILLGKDLQSVKEAVPG